MTVRYSNRAEKDLQNLPIEYQRRVANAVDRFIASPRVGAAMFALLAGRCAVSIGCEWALGG